MLRLFSLALCLALTAPAQAVELRYGQSFIEQGDFILQPGIQLAVADSQARLYRLDFYGRRFGAFTEANLILGMDESLDIFPWKDLKLAYGFSLMDQMTRRSLESTRDTHALNIGLNLGVNWDVYRYEGWNLRAAWNSHIFAAGLAFLFLTTARKSVFSLSVGYNL